MAINLPIPEIDFSNKRIRIIALAIVLLVIISIASFLFSLTSKSQATNYDTTKTKQLNVIQIALENYYADHSHYPTDLQELTKPSENIPGYLLNIPNDPETNKPYIYQVSPEGGPYTSYKLIADKTKDTKGRVPGQITKVNLN